MRIDLQAPDPEILHSAAGIVRAGGLVVYPTDTIYGLGCDAFQSVPIRRLLELKGRSADKGMLVLIRSIDQLESVAIDVSEQARSMLEHFWPGPLTVLFRAAPAIPTDLQGDGGKIGVRWPDSDFLQSWLDLVLVPLVSTSANRSGEAYSGSPDVLRELFERRVDLFLDAGPLPPSQPSTVLDLTSRPFQIVRRGQRAGEVLRFLGLAAESG